VAWDDDGLYECVAMNVLGVVNATVRVTVEGKYYLHFLRICMFLLAI